MIPAMQHVIISDQVGFWSIQTMPIYRLYSKYIYTLAMDII